MSRHIDRLSTRRPPLVLLHGVGESAVGWQPVLTSLSRHYEVTTLDLPGFGSAAPLPRGQWYDAGTLADAVEHRLNDLGIVQPHVAGYSLGGRVALELAGRGRTASVIAISPDGLGTPPERLYQAAALTTARLAAKVLAPVAGPLTRHQAGRSVFFALERSRPWRLPPAQAQHLLLQFARSRGYWGAVGASLVDTPRGLSRITCPVLLLQGTADPLVSGQTPRYLVFVPHARMQWLPGLSHVPISDSPDLVARVMLDFLSEHAAPPQTTSTPAAVRT